MGEKIIAVIGARLNSSRLPKKHLLPLANNHLISHIVKRLRQSTKISDIVIATTADEYNKPLCDWSEVNNVDCFPYNDDVNDLVGRVDNVVARYEADILLYMCGDCPLIEPSVIDKMLEAIIGKYDIDTVNLNSAVANAALIHEGFDIYRRRFWDQMVQVAKEPFE